MKSNFIDFIAFINIHSVYTLSCPEILGLPESTKLTIQELQTIPPKDMVQCLAHLSKEPLGQQEASFIWQIIINYHGGIINIPDQILMVLHWVTPALSPSDYANLTLQNIDVITNFGLDYNLNADQLAALADQVRENYSGKEPEDYTFYDLTALRQILCAFNRSEIERIHASVYRESALLVGKLQHCSPDVLSGFATLAVQRSAFGDPQTWSESTVKTLGVIADNFPKVVKKFHSSTPKP